MTTNRLFILVLISALCGASLSRGAFAQPVRDRVLGDIVIEDHAECALVTVGFEFPIRYLRHFPQSAGNELRIQLEPIAVNPQDSSALMKREAVKPSRSEIAPLSEVIYEGDIDGGLYLTLTFAYPVQFKVAQGPDFRSLVVAIPLPETNLPCEPVSGKEKPLSRE